MPTLDTTDHTVYARQVKAEYEVLADANAGDLTAGNAWVASELATLATTLNDSDRLRSFEDAVALSLDQFHRTYVYTP